MESHSSLHFWTSLWERNRKVFESKEQTNQKLRNSFLCNLSTWVGMYMIDFVDQVGSY